ncbi:hypothetical protein [Nostoc sp. DedSLP04]|uniref:hypothetical protein n=1 Tax=Nostoc sp. DedSLP04 TaxID=3075401 RepID=UPI002AD4B483|nr:hypothetical protein [Nostoc sp. DedSLP04]MDZ8029881.1 hypothetical protein [Nostoc sp. DedSLP04]
MPKSSQLDVIMQQLDALSSAELLAVRAKIDALIEGQSLSLAKAQPPLFRWRNVQITENIAYRGSFSRFTFIDNNNNDVDILAALVTINTPRTNATNPLPTWLRELRQNQVAQFSESEAKVDDTLEKVIGLVDEWMADESGYDEQTYPQVETGLNQNRM